MGYNLIYNEEFTYCWSPPNPNSFFIAAVTPDDDSVPLKVFLDVIGRQLCRGYNEQLAGQWRVYARGNGKNRNHLWECDRCSRGSWEETIGRQNWIVYTYTDPRVEVWWNEYMPMYAFIVKAVISGKWALVGRTVMKWWNIYLNLGIDLNRYIRVEPSRFEWQCVSYSAFK